MDARRTDNPNEMMLSLSLAEAKDFSRLVGNFRHWELIASKENPKPMDFMLRFGTDCSNAVNGFPALTYPIVNGQVFVSTSELKTIADFIKAYVDAQGESMSWMNRAFLKLAWKTLRNRL